MAPSVVRPAGCLGADVDSLTESLKTGKAPGINGIYPETVKALNSASPGVLRDIFNHWTGNREFPPPKK